MRADTFRPTPEGEARLLLLIDAFSSPTRSLQGRTKLAKLDFLLRYPSYFERAFVARTGRHPDVPPTEPDLETPMVRYRYGPWDPAYFALIGRLLGRGLIELTPEARGLGYRTTASGRGLAEGIGANDAFAEMSKRAELLKRHFDLSGETLKRFVYENFPEITRQVWGAEL